jgi:mannose-1-phosphate guanylyltransferase
MAQPPVGMILAAGFGSRLLALTKIRPKPLMELAGIPIIYHLIKIYERAGIKDIFVNLHHGAHQIEKMLRSFSSPCRIHLSHEEEILGTAGGIIRVINKFRLHDQRMVVSHGDILCDIELGCYLESDDYALILCAKDREISGYTGSVGNDSSGSLVELGSFYSSSAQIVERGFFTGIHILSASAVKDLASSPLKGLVNEVYPAWLHEKRALKALMIEMPYEDLGTPDRLWRANMAIFDDKTRFKHIDLIDSNSFLSVDDHNNFIPPFFIHKSAKIEKSAKIGPRVIIGEGVIVKAGAKISNSIVMSYSEIEKLEHLDCAIALGGARVLV